MCSIHWILVPPREEHSIALPFKPVLCLTYASRNFHQPNSSLSLERKKKNGKNLEREELDKESIFLYFKMRKYSMKTRGNMSGYRVFTQCLLKERNHSANSPGPKFNEAKLVLEEKIGWSIFFCRGNMNFCVFHIDTSHVIVFGNRCNKFLLATEYQPTAGCRTESKESSCSSVLPFGLNGH